MFDKTSKFNFMTDAHYHLIFNHFPIIGTILGFGILVFGILFKNNSVKNTAYSLFIVAAVFAALSMFTGEDAEKAVENMPNIGLHIIHEHEELPHKILMQETGELYQPYRTVATWYLWRSLDNQ